MKLIQIAVTISYKKQIKLNMYGKKSQLCNDQFNC